MRLIQKQFIHCNGQHEKNDYDLYKNSAEMANEERIGFLRNLFSFEKARKSIPIEEVESVESIVQTI